MAKLIDDVRIKMGRIVRVHNTQIPELKLFGGGTMPCPSAAPFYYAIPVEDPDGGNERCLLITPNEMMRIEQRSARNREDWPEKSFLTDLRD